MASVNKVILIGNIGRDPETRYTAEGSAITNISIATTDSWKDKATGERKEQTEWHRVTFFGRLAEVVSEYMERGSAIYVEGKLRTRKWTDKDGVERYTTEIIADSMQMLGRKSDGRNHPGSPSYEGERAPAESRRTQADLGPTDDDDIPF